MTTTAPSPGEQETVAPPLEGVTVVLLGGAIAYAGRLLAGLGASVVLVEPAAGCPERRQPPFAPGPLGPGSSLSFAFNAAGIGSVVVDAATRDGAAVLRRALAAADLCLDALGWEGRDPWVDGCRDALNGVAPPPPTCTAGPTGDLDGIGADDLLVQAASGVMYVSGFAEGEPTPAVCDLGRMQAALIAATAGLGLLAGEAAGERAMRVGAQAALALTTLQTSNPGFYTWLGTVPRRAGLGGTGGPVFRCQDGWTTFTPPPERWGAFVAWLDEVGIDASGLPRELAGILSMRDVAATFVECTTRLAARFTKEAFYHDAQGRGLLAMPVNDLADVLADDHLAARAFFVADERGAADLAGPFRSIPSLWSLAARAPRLGEQTEQFLTARLGYTRQQVESLVAMGAVSCGH